MSDNWVVQMLQSALYIWSGKLAEIWSLMTQSPEEFKGGEIWNVIVKIHDGLLAVGIALLVLFFVVGVMRSAGSLAELKRPEVAVKMFIRFILAKAVVTYGMELMLALISIVQGIISTIMTTSGFGEVMALKLPDELVSTIESCGFFDSIPLWIVALLSVFIVWILSIVLIMSVYGRFFKLYMYTAIAPIPLAAFVGEPTQNIGKSFVKSYAAVCLQGAIIVIACIIFSVFAASEPAVDASKAAVTQVWVYIGELIFNMLVLVGAVRMSDRIVKELMGL